MHKKQGTEKGGGSSETKPTSAKRAKHEGTSVKASEWKTKERKATETESSEDKF